MCFENKDVSIESNVIGNLVFVVSKLINNFIDWRMIYLLDCVIYFENC